MPVPHTPWTRPDRLGPALDDKGSGPGAWIGLGVLVAAGILLVMTSLAGGGWVDFMDGRGEDGRSTQVPTRGSGTGWPDVLARGLVETPLGERVLTIAVQSQGWTMITTNLVVGEESRAAELCEAVREIEEEVARGTERRIFVTGRDGSSILAC